MNQKNLLLCLACLALFILSPPSLVKTAACHQSWMGSREIQHAGFEQIFGPKSQDFFQNNNLFFQTQGYQMWPLTKNVPYERMQGMRTYGKRMDEKWIAKPFAMERLNGWTDDENVWMDEVERINGWRKFLNGCSRTDGENFWTDEVERMNGWRKILSDWLWCAEYFSFRWVGANSRREVRIQCIFAITQGIRVIAKKL